MTILPLERRAFILAFLGLALAGIASPSVAISLGAYSSVVGPTAGSGSDVVVAVGAWSATTGASWLHLTNASGTNSGLATFTYDSNSGASRIGTISFNGGASTLTVTQAGASFVATNHVTTLVGTTASTPVGVAVDGAGNVYVLDSGNAGTVKEWQVVTQQETTPIPSGLNSNGGVAVDAAGNIYFADTNKRNQEMDSGESIDVSTRDNAGVGPQSTIWRSGGLSRECLHRRYVQQRD